MHPSPTPGESRIHAFAHTSAHTTVAHLRPTRRSQGRRESITSALATAQRRHGWQSFDALSALAWRMLDESPKTRVDLPKVV